MSFHSESKPTARKEHRCNQCGKLIEIGTRYRRAAGVWEGEFWTSVEHLECYEAWRELNFSRDLRDLDAYEGAVFLRDDDHEDDEKEWMREKHPLVASRLGWGVFPTPPAKPSPLPHAEGLAAALPFQTEEAKER